MRINPVVVAAASLSSLVTLCATILVIMLMTNSFREPTLSNLQRAELKNMVNDQVGDALERASKMAKEANFSETQRNEIARLIRETLRTNPDIVQEALSDLIKKRVLASSGAAATSPAPNQDKSALIKGNAAALFSSAHQVTIGNLQGDVTLVEFFDYNCGFCKRALADTLDLLKTDQQLKIVLKEFPILGPSSIEAAKVAIAVRMQDSTGAKYLEFHQKLLGSGLPANKANALAVAQEVGLDVQHLQKEMDSEEVRQTLEENMTLARTLGINGTPGYVIGDTIIPGAVGVTALKEKIFAARNRHPG